MKDSLIKLTRGVPPEESFPIDRVQECAEWVLRTDGYEILQYGGSRGYPRLREAIAREKGVDEGRVIVGQGSLQLQDFCARLLIEPGAVAYVEEPTYDRTLTILRRAKAQVVGFPLTDDGVDVEVVEARLASGERPGLFYLIPDFQNPSGTVLSEEKRQRIVRLARATDFWIIEDVPYRRLRYRGEDVPSLFELAPDRVLQMSSYSKLIGPGLRVGYVVAPEPLAGRLADMAEDTYINASYLNQAIVAEFIRRDWLEPQIKELRDLYEPRLYATLRALGAHMSDLATWHRPEGGFFVGVTVNGRVDTDALLSRAQDRNLLLTDGRSFFAERGNGSSFVRFPFCALTAQEIEEGVRRLAQVVRDLV
ncbi:MAG: PLP-dependent aminotransferase family protein [Chloroflexota bacterium]